MIVGWGNVGNERAEGVEWSTMTFFNLAFHIFLNLMHWHMTRTFDKCLYILSPSTLYEFAHSIELGKLCCIVGIIGRTRTQAIAQRNGNIIFSADVADVIEMFVEETLLLMHLAPLRDDAATTAHDACQTSIGKMDIL